MVAGLEEITGGEIAIGGRVVNKLEPSERDIAMVFQNYALYPHMSVFDNMAYGLKIAKVPPEQIRARVDKAARILELSTLLERKPRQLSGGQRQRVAMGRAIVREPQVFLFDEPLSNLDAKLRAQTRIEIRKLHAELGVTSLFVTHDQVEAMTLAQRMIVMNAGRIEQIGTPEEVFDHPANGFVMDFLGNVNVFHGRVEDGRAVAGGLELAFPEYPHGEAKPATVYVRPHELEIDRHAGGPSALRAEVLRINPAGASIKVELLAHDFGLPLNVVLAPERHAQLRLGAGEQVYVFPKRVRVFVQDYSI